VQLHALAKLGWRSVVQARYFFLATLCLLCGFQIVIVGQAAAIEEANSFNRIAELIPGFLQRGLGNQAMLLATFKGTVAFGYFHPVVAVLTSIVAVYFATEPAHEVEAGLVDLTLARSIPRHVVVTRSLLLTAGAVVAATVFMAAGSRIGLRLFASPAFDAPSASASVRMLAHLAAVALCFGSAGLAVAAGARRWSPAFITVSLATVLLYLLDFLSIGWPMMRALSWISPFRYYPALAILSGTAPPLRNIAILLSAASLFTAAAYWRFSRRDL
jgi:ABC-type transport system involved in multi-copper enzyme maturation permease subunit